VCSFIFSSLFLFDLTPTPPFLLWSSQHSVVNYTAGLEPYIQFLVQKDTSIMADVQIAPDPVEGVQLDEEETAGMPRTDYE
jgi:hypothetical protein